MMCQRLVPSLFSFLVVLLSGELRCLVLIALLVGSPAYAGNGVDSAYVPAGYQKVFDDEFSTANLDTTKWWTRYIYSNGTLDYLNDELQRYRENHNHVIVNQTLQLTARLPGDGSIESGMVRSKMTFNGGYFEAKMRVPPGLGTWPAFWLNSDAAPDGSLRWPPEIDIMENVINAPDANSCCEHPNMTHTGGRNDGPQSNAILLADPNFNADWSFWTAPYNFYDEFHIWGLLWDATAGTITTYIDGQRIVKRRYYWTYDNNKPAPNAHVLVNLAIGGSWAGLNGVDWNAFPQALEVAYVRVYQPPNRRETGASSIGQDLCPTGGGC
jgi:beta-glucanase (GH16 family)